MERFWACALSAKRKSAARRIAKFIGSSSYSYGAILAYAQLAQRLRAPRLGSRVDSRVETFAAAVHGDEQRTEAAHAEFPQRLRIKIVEVDVLDRYHPRGLERRGPADDREVRA